MNIVESLTWANNKLKEFDVDAPMLDAQLLLARILNVAKNYLFTHFDQTLTEPQLHEFETLVERRRHREPLAYILGWQEFYNRPFKINNFVLIPRPETELLVEEAIALGRGEHDVLYIDVGTGSGAISVTLAAETTFPVIATEISARAIAVAEQNIKLHKVGNRLTLLEGDLLSPIGADLVKSINHVILCANLPYLSTREWQETQPEVHDYEPRLALDGGVDGLDVYHALLKQLADRRADFPTHVTLLLEIDPDQKISAPLLVHQFFPSAEVQIKNDLSDRPRLLIAELRF